MEAPTSRWSCLQKLHGACALSPELQPGEGAHEFAALTDAEVAEIEGKFRSANANP